MVLSLRSVVPALRCPCAPLSLRLVVPAPRRSCASSFLLLMASLALLLALLPPDARAGYYAVTYTGGNSTTTDQPPQPPTNDSATGASWGGGNGAVYGCPGGSASLSNTASCAGKITATLTWTHGSGQADQNDPAPQVELVQEGCDANWSTNQSSAQAGYTATGTFGNPFWVGAAPSGGFSGDERAGKYSVLGERRSRCLRRCLAV